MKVDCRGPSQGGRREFCWKCGNLEPMTLFSCLSVGIFGGHWSLPTSSDSRGAQPQTRSLYGKPEGMFGSGHNSANGACDAAPVVGERRADRQVDDDAPNRRLDPGAQLDQA